ncbi:MAG TPA: OmpA family protein [Polyangiales bacterium]|nr:OmpA family protein [Polyangiales bacterium]
MRLIVAFVLAWSVAAPAFADDHAVRLDLSEKDIDIANRTIRFSMGTVAAFADIEVFTPEGKLLHAGHANYDDPAPGTKLEIGWPDLGPGHDNYVMDLKFTDTDGSWVEYHVVRFYFEIPHEELEFDSGKAIITPEERAKLDTPLELLKDAVAKYSKMVDISLYVVGHTDTVGPAADNQKLSDKRAQAIASVFTSAGIKPLAVSVRGCGEGALAVKTADNVPERKNRRAQYIVASFVPQIACPGNWRRVQ